VGADASEIDGCEAAQRDASIQPSEWPTMPPLALSEKREAPAAFLGPGKVP
jgi:hypothetical protein